MANFQRESVTFDQALDFTRASPAWGYNANGDLVEYAVDEPRLVYDPETGEALGLLIEEQRTNFATHNSGATPLDSWTTTNVTVAGVADEKFEQAIDLTADPTEGYHNVHFEGPQDGLTHMRTVAVKKVDMRYVVLSQAENPTAGSNSSIFDLDTGEFTQEANGGNPHYVEREGGGWYRIGFYRDSANEFSNKFSIGLTNSPTGSGGNHQFLGAGEKLLIALPQLEAGSSPSSYIKTEGAQVTREADNCSRTLGAEFNPGEGSITATAKARTGDTVFRIGDVEVMADTDDEKTYTVEYTADPSATELEIMPGANGYIKELTYEPR